MWPEIRHTLTCRRFTHSHVSWQECAGLLVCGSFHGDNELKITAETAFPVPFAGTATTECYDALGGRNTHTHAPCDVVWGDERRKVQ